MQNFFGQGESILGWNVKWEWSLRIFYCTGLDKVHKEVFSGFFGNGFSELCWDDRAHIQIMISLPSDSEYIKRKSILFMFMQTLMAQSNISLSLMKVVREGEQCMHL